MRRRPTLKKSWTARRPLQARVRRFDIAPSAKEECGGACKAKYRLQRDGNLASCAGIWVLERSDEPVDGGAAHHKKHATKDTSSKV